MMYVWSKLRIYLAFCKGTVRHALTFSRGIKSKSKNCLLGPTWQMCPSGRFVAQVSFCKTQLRELLQSRETAKLWHSAKTRNPTFNELQTAVLLLVWQILPIGLTNMHFLWERFRLPEGTNCPPALELFSTGRFSKCYSVIVKHLWWRLSLIPPIWSSNSTFLRLESH